MLVPMTEILQKSREGHYGVIAPNICNEDSARAAIEAAAETNSPIILDLIYSASPDITLLAHIVKYLADRVSVPVALNLDHGGEFKQHIEAVRAGFSSIMVDRSSLPYEQNVAEVAELVKVAHSVGMSVEAELGHVGTAADGDGQTSDLYPNVDQAADFVERTGCDALAVAIGTAHGKYPAGYVPHLDFDRLHELYNAVEVPLVLHGGSGSGDDNLARATREGITKVNVGTSLFSAGMQNLADHVGELTRANLGYKMISDAYKAELIRHMELVGQVGKA